MKASLLRCDASCAGRMHEGIASYYLKQRKAGALVPVFVRHSSFRLPKDLMTPIVMVGPGPGLAGPVVGVLVAARVVPGARRFFLAPRCSFDQLQ